MRRASLIVLCLLIASAASAQNISRPRNGYIVDQTSTIKSNDARVINQISRDISNRTGGELLVAVVRSTNGQNPNHYATRLFNRWRIGDRYANNGILVFVAMNDRKAEIILGDGIDSAREERHARDVMSDYMMPKFKQRQPSKGIRIAVEELSKRFFKNSVQNSVRVEPIVSSSDVVNANPQPSIETTSTADYTSNTEFESETVEIVPAEMNLADAVSAETVDSTDFAVTTNVAFDSDQDEMQEPIAVDHANAAGHQVVRHAPDRPLRKQPFNWLGLLFGTGATAGGVGLSYRLLTARRRPRNCDHCQQPMMLLDEVSDDQHLSSSERLEEQLGSVDYDVWCCTSCSHLTKVRYGAFFTRYSKCPRCRAKTSSSVTRTISPATTISTGLKEVEESCQNCDYHRITRHVIPRIVQSNHSTGSSSFSSGGSSFGGGGTSSGGGASGGW